MNPLNDLKLIVDSLKGTPLEYWVNILLFVWLVAVVIEKISLVVGKKPVMWIAKLWVILSAKLRAELTYVGVAQVIQDRFGPYVELIYNLYMVLFGVYFSVVISLAFYFLYGKSPWYAELIGMLLFMASALYIRWSIAGASRAYEKIRSRKQ